MPALGPSTKRDRKLEAIRAAATRLFAERGIAQTRMADIAAELDMQAGSLYYYVASKEELLTDLVASRVALAVELLERVVDEAAEPEAMVRQGIREHVQLFAAHADLFRLFQVERLAEISSGSADEVRRLGYAYESVWRRILTRGVEAGVLAAELDVPVTAKAIIAMCSSTLSWFDPGGRLGVDDVADRFGDLVLQGSLRKA